MKCNAYKQLTRIDTMAHQGVGAEQCALMCWRALVSHRSMIGMVLNILKLLPLMLHIVVINHDKLVRAARPRASAEVQISLC